MTAILYLNGEWQPADGGTLRIYGPAVSDHPEAREAAPEGGRPAERYVEIEPRRGTLALFWSHRVEHEVMPARTPRFALSLWMCVAPEQPAGWLS